MRFDIDFSGGKKPWAPSWGLIGERLLAILSSTPFMVLVMGILVVGIGYFAVFVPLFGVSPVHKTQLRDLQTLQAGIQQNREGLLREGRVALTIQAEAPGWAAR